MESFRGQEGASLLGLIAFLGISVLSFALFSRSYVQNIKNETALKTLSAYQDVDDLIEGALAELFNQNLTQTKCLPASALKNIDLGEAVHLKNRKIHLKTSASPDVKQAVQRCSAAVVRADLNNSTRNMFHFCFEFDVGNELKEQLPPNSFLKSEHAFVEITAELKDFSTNQNISCSDFIEGANTSLGMRIYYSIYWAKNLEKTQRKKTSVPSSKYRRRNGYLIINRES